MKHKFKILNALPLVVFFFIVVEVILLLNLFNEFSWDLLDFLLKLS